MDTSRTLLLASLPVALAACADHADSPASVDAAADVARDVTHDVEDAGDHDATQARDASDAGPWAPPPGTNPACVSGERWEFGNRRSILMNPGQACLACHRRMSGPPHTAAGTVFHLRHEEDGCYGYTGTIPGGGEGAARVELVDAEGQSLRLTVNLAGNFLTRTALRFPLRSARVVGPTGRVSAMRGEVPHGDCNACHTRDGSTTVPGAEAAPGRVTVPL